MLLRPPPSELRHHSRAEEAQAVGREAVNRWTDNIETLRDYLKSQMQGAEDQIKQLFDQASLQCPVAHASSPCMREGCACAAWGQQPGILGVIWSLANTRGSSAAYFRGLTLTPVSFRVGCTVSVSGVLG